jgi:P pilus assembly protein, pilin FimA
MKISKQLLTPVLSCALLISAGAQASSVTPGKLAMNGELIEAACSINPDSRNLWVEFGDISASVLNMNEDGVLTHPFLVHLIGCSIVTKGQADNQYPFATVTFIGETSASDPTALLTSGDADGVGIRLRDQHGEILTLGIPSPGYKLSDEDNILKFTASLIPVKRHIKAGEFYATARFFIDYN